MFGEIARQRLASSALALAGICCFIAAASAAEVEIRIVKHDNPQQLISEGLDRPVVQGCLNARPAVFVDGKLVVPDFEQFKDISETIQGLTAKIDLAAGEHAIEPGGLKFTVNADGTVSSKAPALLAEKNVLRVRTAPVTFRYLDAETDRVLAGYQVLQFQVYSGQQRVYLLSWYRWPRDVATLRLYLPPSEAAYRIAPLGVEFTVDDTGKVALKPQTDQVVLRGTDVCMKAYPFRLFFSPQDHSTSVLITNQEFNAGNVADLYGGTGPYCVYLPYRATPFSASTQQGPHRFSRAPQDKPLYGAFSIDLTKFPFYTQFIQRWGRFGAELVTGISTKKLQAGDKLRVQIHVGDDRDMNYFSNPAFTCGIKKARYEPTGEAAWQELPLVRDGNDYSVELPKTLDSDRYRIRFTVTQTGSDRSLSNEFVIAVVNKDQAAALGVHLPAGRLVYVQGEDVEVQVTASARKAVAGTLRLEAVHSQEPQKPVTLRQTPVNLAQGFSAFGFVMDGACTSALRPGAYKLAVTVADAAGQTIARSSTDLELVTSVPRTDATVLVWQYGNRWIGNALGGDLADNAKLADFHVNVWRIDCGGDCPRSGGYDLFEWAGLPAGNTAIFPDDPDLPPADTALVPVGLKRGFEQFLRNRTLLLPSTYWGDGPVVELAIPEFLAQQRRITRIYSQFLRAYPNYGGLAYSQWTKHTVEGQAHGGYNVPPATLKVDGLSVAEMSRKLIVEEFVAQRGLKNTRWQDIGNWTKT